jgi:hypothetical protein
MDGPFEDSCHLLWHDVPARVMVVSAVIIYAGAVGASFVGKKWQNRRLMARRD